MRKLETIVNGNDAFDFTINKDNGGVPGDVIAGPYRVFDTSPATVGTIIKNVPGIDPPEITQGDFWVLINWLEPTPGAPGIGADTDQPIDNRSMYYRQAVVGLPFPVLILWLLHMFQISLLVLKRKTLVRYP